MNILMPPEVSIKPGFKATMAICISKDLPDGLLGSHVTWESRFPGEGSQGISAAQGRAAMFCFGSPKNGI